MTANEIKAQNEKKIQNIFDEMEQQKAEAAAIADLGKIFYIACGFSGNDVKVISESKKAVKLEVTGDKRFVDCVGVSAWFPKSALEVDSATADGECSVRVKDWFIRKASIWQERVIGRVGW